MHLDHNHTHTHTHTHSHSHDHDHAHDHDHVHDHAHEHGHDHGHVHAQGCDHTHCGEHTACAGCSHTHEPREELIALMRYMVGHNTQHANELAGFAKKLDDMGDHVAYEQVMQAVADFEKGNLRLSTVLAALDHK